MEEHPQGVIGADFKFHRHRGIHLESKTYHTLLQIFTHCYGNSPLLPAPPILPPLSPSGYNGGNRGLSDGDDLGRREPNDSAGPEGTALDGGVKDAGGRGAIDSTQRTIDELEQIMHGEDNGIGSIIGNETEGSGSRERDISREQILMNELQDVMEGSEEWFNDGGANFHDTVLEDAQGNDGVSGHLNNGEQFSDLQRLAEEESGSPGQEQSEKECRLEAAVSVVSPLEIGLLNKGEQFADLQRIPEEESGGTGHAQSEKEEYRLGADGPVIPPSEIGGTDDVLKPSGNSEQVSSTQHKETGYEQLGSSHHIVPSTGELVESHELEEGEISGDDSGCMVLDDGILSEQSTGDQRQLSNDLINKNECTPNEVDGSKRISMESPPIHVVHGKSRSKKIEFEESNLKKMVHEDKVVPREIVNGSEESPGNLDQIGNNMKEVTSREKDDSLCKKRKRGPGKEKKRAKERKKRAKMRRELGLDRVKVKPIVKPKTVSYCRHYLAGRCQEGEKCKFSHDVVPLTKSKPCRYFSRDACMKGDDCPFDHQLSKYPCDNYTNKGFCSRGDSCLFSHQMPSEEGAPSLLKPEKSDPKSPKPSSVNTKQQQNASETPRKMVSGEQNMEPLSKLSSSKPPMAVASGTGQRKLPPRRTQSRTSGGLTSESALDASKNIKSSNESVVSKTVAAPAGINFLSFSKGPSAVSSGKNLASLILSGGDGSKQLPNKNSNGLQDSSAASREQNSTQMGRESPLAVPPRGLSFLSVCKYSEVDCSQKADAPSSEKDGHLPESRHASAQQHMPSPITGTGSSSGSCRLSEQLSHKNATNSTLGTLNSSPLVDGGPGKNKSAQESQHAPDKQFIGTIPWKLSVNPSATGQSSVQSKRKSISNLRQDPVMSTLSWASNFNSKPASLPGTGSVVGGGGESSTAAESHSVKVSKILDFLSSIGSKTKH